MQIILSADDLGRSLQRNVAISEALKLELVQSAALMVATPFTEDAVNKLPECLCRLHCHFNVVGGSVGGFQKPLTNGIIKDPYICDGASFRDNCDHRLNGRIGVLRIFTFIPVLKELNAQYKEFIRITEGKRNNTHVDFHLYQNLNFPIALAFRIFTIVHGIKTARFIGEHLKNSKRNRLLFKIGKSAFVKTYPSCNIDYYLMNREKYSNYDVIELYVHPDMVDGDIQDNSMSVYGNEKRSLKDNIDLIKSSNPRNSVQFVSWNNI